jgi:hypothetical protein
MTGCTCVITPEPDLEEDFGPGTASITVNPDCPVHGWFTRLDYAGDLHEISQQK